MKEWEKVKLGTLLTESKVVSESPDAHKRITVKLNVQGIEKRPVTSDKAGATKYYVRSAGQFIYGKQNLHKGAFGIVPIELDGFESSADIPAFDVDDSCYPEWIYYFFRKENFYLKLEALAKGVGSKRIHPHQIFDLDIFLPEKKEQRKILDKIVLIEARHNKLISELEKQKREIPILRYSIIEEAIRGEVTEDWRKNNLNKNLINELSGGIEGNKKISFSLINKKDIPFEIPQNWSWIKFGNVIELISGQHIKSTDYNISNTGIPYLTGPSDFGEYSPVFSKWSDKPKVIAKKGDILITVKGSGVGKLNVLHEDAAIGRQLMAIRSNIVSREYLYFFLQSMNKHLQNLKVGIAIPGISRSDILNMPFALPPLDEQKIIIQRVDEFMARCIQLEQINNENIREADYLFQAVLSEQLGKENNFLPRMEKRRVKQKPKYFRILKYDSKTTLMELIELLKEHGKLHAEDLWRMSKHPNDIDAFYTELKQQIELKKTIKEVKNEKGYLELA